MRQLFLTVLSLSISGTLIGLMIAVTHPITGKYFSKRWNYYIWLLVIVRLLLPFPLFPALRDGPGWQINLAQTAPDNSNNTADVPSAPGSITPPSVPDMPVNTANTQYTKLPDSTPSGAAPFDAEPLSARILTAAAYIWFFGAVTALIAGLLRYYRFQLHVKKDSICVDDNRVIFMENAFCAKLHIDKIPAIYKSAAVSGPMTIGLRNPVIIIPTAFCGLDPAQLQLALHHELIHVARKDLLYKWICQLLLCVHWFNPFLRRIGRQINSDCELSCDEAILAELTESGKQLYGNILLDTAARGIDYKGTMLSTTLLDNKKNLKKRLDGILRYRKMTRVRLAVSACVLVIMLTVSACSTVWISPRDPSVSESPDSSDFEVVTPADDDPDDHSLFTQILTSLISSDRFLDTSVSPDRSSDAWKVYDDDTLLAGDDIKDNWYAYNYFGVGRKIRATGFILYGSDSILITYADREIDVKIKSSFDISEGSFKVVYVAPDKSVLTLNDTGAETTQTITMQKGRNVLKMVGKGAKLKNLEIDYSDLKESKFEKVYHSSEEEYSALLTDGALSGAPVQKDQVMDVLYVMDDQDASEVFRAMLAAGTVFTGEELCDFLIYSDAALSSQYLVEAVRAGTIEPPDASILSEAMPYLERTCAAELLKSLPMEEFYDVFSENCCYLNSSQIEECLTDYMDRGGVLTYSMYDDIRPFLNNSMVQKLDRLPMTGRLPQ